MRRRNDETMSVKVKEAIILAGGFGTRLQGVVKDLPKPMAPVNGRPFLTYILDYLIDYEYQRVVLSVGWATYMRKLWIISERDTKPWRLTMP